MTENRRERKTRVKKETRGRRIHTGITITLLFLCISSFSYAIIVQKENNNIKQTVAEHEGSLFELQQSIDSK